jgi:hypothetical protein
MIQPRTLVTGVSPDSLLANGVQFTAPEGFSVWYSWPGFHHFRVRWQMFPVLLVSIKAFIYGADYAINPPTGQRLGETRLLKTALDQPISGDSSASLISPFTCAKRSAALI